MGVRGLGWGWLHGQLSLRFCSESFNSGDFFLRFFHLSRRQFKGGYTCDFHLALATRQNLKKSHHQREQKIARVAAALAACANGLHTSLTAFSSHVASSEGVGVGVV